jgi:hypothetical protein
MKPEEVQHLLGGYAAGTLTPEEQKLLFSAAMEDQELFNALADEQTLKELLDDPESRGYLRAALEEEVTPSSQTSKSGWWYKAAGLSVLAAMLTIVTVMGIRKTATPASENKVDQVAAVAPKPAESQVAQNQTQASVPELDSQGGATRPGSSEATQRPTPVKDMEQEPARKLKSEAAADGVSTRRTPAAAPLPPPVTAAAESKRADKPVGVVASAPAAPPPAVVRPVVAEEARAEREMAKSSSTALSVGSASRLQLQAQLSASNLFLAQYRQSFVAVNQQDLLPPPPAPQRKRMRDQQSSAQEQQQLNRAVPEDQRAMNNQRAGLAMNQAQTVAVAVTNRGIRYQILRRNSQGQFVQTRLDTRFEAGDEIQIQVEKNAPGVVAILSAPPTSGITIASQTATSAQTAPIRLRSGILDLSIVFADSPADRATPAAPGQLAEQSGNLMYVVLPGAVPNPVVAQLRITVH